MKRIREKFAFLIVLCFAGCFLLPVILMVTGAFLDSMEFRECFGPVFFGSEGFAHMHLVPEYPSIGPTLELLFDTPEFFIMFFNSCIQVFPVIILQFFISVPAAWAFARFTFPGRKVLFYFYIALMIMPFQVTMVSDYLVLYRLELLDTHGAIILCQLFSTFPVFIMEKFFRGIPDSLIEAARLDGAGECRLFFRIGMPLGVNGMAAIGILDFIEYWNALEQPLIFLKNKSLWSLSLYLSDVQADQADLSMAASVLMLMPSLCLFLWGQDYLEQGIVASGMKE